MIEKWQKSREMSSCGTIHAWRAPSRCRAVVRRCFIVATALLAIVAGVVADELAPPRIDPKDYLACGVNCLFVTARIKGTETDLAAVESLIKPDSNGNSTFADLAFASQELGLSPVALSLPVGQISSIPAPAILHVKQLRGQVDGNHFVVYLGATDAGDVCVLDPPQEPTLQNREAFLHRWTGNVLIPCKNEAEASSLRNEFSELSKLHQVMSRPWYSDTRFWSASLVGIILLIVIYWEIIFAALKKKEL